MQGDAEEQLYFYASDAFAWFYFRLSAVILKVVKMVKSAGKGRVAWMVQNDVPSYHPVASSGPFPLETGHHLFSV